MAATEPDSRESDKGYCLRCRGLLPITEFRFRSKDKGVRHRECRDCRREHQQKRSTREAQRRVRHGFHKLRRLSSVVAIEKLLDLLAYEAGGHEQLAKTWWKLMSSPDIPLPYRITACKAMFQLGAAVQATRSQCPNVRSKEDLKQIPKANLVDWIRWLRFEGNLTIDDVDPDPGSWWPDAAVL